MINTKEIRQKWDYGHPSQPDIFTLCDEVDRLEALILARDGLLLHLKDRHDTLLAAAKAIQRGEHGNGCACVLCEAIELCGE